MDSQHGPSNGRTELTFSLEGLADREQTLFKSFVRLLDHRTHQHWVWRNAQPDLRVIGEELARTVGGTGSAVLALVTTDAVPCHHLRLPIHADALERQLNQIGDLLQARPQRTSTAVDSVIGPDDLVHLSRWPTPELLSSRDRIRLATLLTGRPLSVDDVQSRSGVAREACLEFVEALVQSGMLVFERASSARAPVSAAVSGAVQSGLLSRIRARLGLGARLAA